MTAEGEIATSAEYVGPSPDSCFATQNGGVPPPSTARVREPKRPVVAVDVDEVLGYFVSQLCAFHNKNYGTELTPEDFTSYYFHEVCPQERLFVDMRTCANQAAAAVVAARSYSIVNSIYLS